MRTSSEKFRNLFIKNIGIIFFSFFGAAVFCLIGNVWYTLRYSGLLDVKSRILLALQVPVGAYAVAAAVFFFAAVLWKKFGDKIGRYLYQYRFSAAIVLWILCICFKINGTSAACWGDFLGKDIDARGLLLGMSRIIRSDEWATYTPMMLSQQYGVGGGYPYFSEILRGTVTDTFIVYGLPVKDVAVLFRPFHWGFLFLDAERGFSFYWCGRLIALAMVSFEFGMLITKKNKLYAFIMALLLTLSPTVQWWIGVNGLVEMLVFGQLAILCIYYYMHTEDLKIRILCGLLTVICAGGFILVFYPAWQIPIAYMVLGLLVWVVADSWKEFHFQAAKDIPLLAGGLLLLGSGMLYVFFKSSDSVAAVLNTAYPGKRISRGGGVFFEMLRYGGNFFLPLISENLPGNHCEMSAFISFAPLGVLFSFYLLWKEKKRDLLLIILLIVNIFLQSFMIFQYPAVLAEATLLSRSMPEKITQIIGILDILMLFRALALLETHMNKRTATSCGILFSAVISVVNRKIYGAYLSPVLLLGLFVILFLGCFLLLRGKERYTKIPAALFFSMLMFVSGGLVNPVQQGFDVIYDTDLMEETRNIVSKDPDGLWICDNLGYPMNDFFIMGGAPTIDSINTYPAMERWKQLDTDGKYEEIYNRYAHIATSLVQDETRFEMDMLHPDSFSLLLNINDLKKMGVSYVVSNRDLSGMDNETLAFEQIAEAQDVRFYKVNDANE